MAIEIRVPRLGWSMEEGTFLRWLKASGERVDPADVLYELESDKATQEVESMDSGILHIPADAPQPGDTVAVGALLGFLLGANESPPPTSAAGSTERETPAPETATTAAQVPGQMPAVSLSAGSSVVVATPRARRVARELGVEWASLEGSGRGGRVREADVRAAAQSGSHGARQESKSRELRRPLTSRRRAIAQRMLAGAHSPAPVTLTTRADATNLVALRRRFQAHGDAAGPPGYTDMIVSCVAQVLKDHSLLAARWDGEDLLLPATGEFDICLAVDTDEGLLAPVLRNAGQMALAELAACSRDLARRARAGKLAPHELQGGVFTVTNLGAYGIDAFTPIINFPQTAILGVGAVRQDAVVTGDGRIEARHQITLSLTFDHRVLDGAPAARFLQDLVRSLEKTI